MAGINPFLTANTPLKNAPYYSRVGNTNLIDSTDNVNYPMLAFKPGYALQASELNEIQDNFYVQKTLSDNLLQNWWKTGTNLTLTGSTVESLYGPGWEGAIPLTPNQLQFNDLGTLFYFSNATGYGTKQWFLVTDPNTKFKFWAVIDIATLNASILAKGSLPAITYVGIKIESSFVSCSSTETDPGYIFNDNSSGNYIQNTCGASRFKIKLKATGGIVAQTSITSDFLPILKIRKNADIPSQNAILIQYMNNYLIHKETV